MKQVTKFTRANCGDVAAHMMKVLEAEAEKMGLVVERHGRGTFDRDGSSFQFGIRFIAGGEEGKEDKVREEFKRNAFWYGLEEQDYGAILNIRGTKYKLVRINTRAKRYPFECERVGGGTGIRLPDVYKHEILAVRSK